MPRLCSASEKECRSARRLEKCHPLIEVEDSLLSEKQVQCVHLHTIERTDERAEYSAAAQNAHISSTCIPQPAYLFACLLYYSGMHLKYIIKHAAAARSQQSWFDLRR